MKKMRLEVFDQNTGAPTGDIVEVMVDLDGFNADLRVWNLEKVSDIYAQHIDGCLAICCEVRGKDPGSVQYTRFPLWKRLPATLIP